MNITRTYKLLHSLNRVLKLINMQTVGCFCGNKCASDVPHYISSSNSEATVVAVQNMRIYEDFITEEEEQTIMKELEPYVKRMRYETSHWDNVDLYFTAIHSYRETEKSNWNKENKAIIDRIRKLAFAPEDKQLVHVHVLDITADGYIKPHVDSIKFCGDTITGLSLLSSSVMRLVHEKHKQQSFDILLKQRSLYVMKGDARYQYTHEILPDNLSYFKSVHIPRSRRISVICRNAPPDDEN